MFQANHAAVLKDIDFIFPNREEALLMSGTDDPYLAAALIRAFGVKTVIVKLGSQGCLIAADQALIHVPAPSVACVVDTTGAGDAFCGGFLAATLWGIELITAAKIGHTAAAAVIGQWGGRAGAPTLDQMTARLAQYGDTALAAVLRHVKNTVGYG